MTGIRVEIQGLKEAQAKMEQVARDVHGTPMVDAMKQATLLVEGDAKRNAPVDTGRLRASIMPEVRVAGVFNRTVQGVVGSNVQYACIFNAHTNIITKSGGKTIGQIEVGDYVLSQDGLYHKVVAKNIFPATEKPELIDIEAYWRAGHNHNITLTIDHKVLVYRNGRNKWVEAGELEIGDQLYQRKKIAHNKGKSKYSSRICINCGKEYERGHGEGKTMGIKYCSHECRYEHWAAGNNPHIGRKRAASTRKKISERIRERIQNDPQSRLNCILARRGFVTSHEQEIKDWLDDMNAEYKFQEPIGKHVVDFYVPSINTIFEADGAYWHQDQQKDIDRDKKLLSSIPEACIFHIHFYDNRFSPELNTCPIDNVYYVPVNPGMSSFTNLDVLCASEVVALRRWIYVRPPGKWGAKVAKLYDLSVEGMHSFFANGLLVSNSHVEMGTGPAIGNSAYSPPATNVAGWAHRHGISAYTVVEAIRRKGTKAYRYLQRAVEDNADRIQSILAGALDKIADK